MLHSEPRRLTLGLCGPALLVACGPPAPAAHSSTPGRTPAAESVLVDDFEDGDGSSLLGGGWYAYDDRADGGKSELKGAQPGRALEPLGEGRESARSLLVEYTFDAGTLPYEPFIGFGVSLGAAHADLRDHGVLQYAYRGGAHEVRIETSNVQGYDWFAVQLPDSARWKTVELPFTLFRQGGWGPKVPFDLAAATNLSWQVRGATGESGKLEVDDVRLLPATAVERGPADLRLHDPEPPARREIASTSIDHPLQRIAMASLDRGFNLTNYLEAKRFEGHGKYDEAFIQRLAAAGFRSLRLPIDLDRYVEKRRSNNGRVDVVLHPDLFRVLDDYERWTRAHGLGLTIAYHQYDHSFEIADPNSVGEVVTLWAEVAEHFAGNPRADLFYEILNEPELSSGSRGPTASEWTAVSREVISAIRRHDTTRPIIFGDVKWYDIDRLVERTPFADPNVIYAFHFYEPFLFTHQGASWVGMSSTHDVPYPYAKGRWSDHMEDLGFTEFNEQWHLDLLHRYHREANRNAIRNRLIEVKQWAVTHGVPVICNELGVHMASAREEDIARYYADLSAVFEELEIPWHVWFQLMDAETGKVTPAYRDALGLEPPRP